MTQSVYSGSTVEISSGVVVFGMGVPFCVLTMHSVTFALCSLREPDAELDTFFEFLGWSIFWKWVDSFGLHMQKRSKQGRGSLRTNGMG